MYELNNSKIIEKIGNIADPDLGYTLSSLNAIKNVKIDNNKVEIEIELIPPIEWVADRIKAQCLQNLSEFSDYSFEINIKDAEIKQIPKQSLKDVKFIIAVASGKGGVGKSAIASNIAAAIAQKGVQTGLIDADIYGPSQPTMWGMKGSHLPAEERDGKTIVYPAEKYGIKIASMGFLMQENEAAIVRGPILASYLQMLIEQIEWGKLDFLIFDLPPGTGDIQLTLTQKVPLTGSVIVTTPQEIAVVDVRRSIKMFEQVKVPVLGVVENMSYFVPPDTPDKKYYIFGNGGGKRIADESKVRFLGEVPLLQQFRESNDNGLPFVLNEDAGTYRDEINKIVENIIQEVRRINYASNKTSDLIIEI
ncbi:Mrp/NBP35 family ATP-binding protein [bacterium]|nr:Mrp/NBP35 family ATP-binding protein [bacterium]